ncbi:MAG: hypothetical protein KDD54_07205, partial [Flavobacteriales bacterium]|nr:hypothetical protein [Flavobacteriales bacterium]
RAADAEAKRKADEDARRAADAEAKRKADEAAKRAADAEAKRKADEDAARQVADARAGKQAREAEAARLKAEQEENDRKVRAAQAAAEARRKAAADAKMAEAKRLKDNPPKISLTKKIEAEKNKDYPEGKTEELIEERTRTIKKVIISREGNVTIYKQINYQWGGIFFFKDDESISKDLFERETAD